MESIKKYLLYFLILVYVSGSIGFVLNPDFFSPFTPFTLLLTCFVYLSYQPYNHSKFLWSFFILALIGYIFEIIGVKTGFIFGHYYYGNGLGSKVLEVPLIISLNWALLISIGINIAYHFFKNKYVVLIIGSLIATFTDVLIEQVASKLDFWKFDSGLAGIHNYVGWFLISFFAGLLCYKPLIKGQFKSSLIILLLQLLFFTTIYIF